MVSTVVGRRPSLSIQRGDDQEDRGAISQMEKGLNLLHLLRKVTDMVRRKGIADEIKARLEVDPNLTQTEIAKELGVARDLVGYHIRRGRMRPGRMFPVCAGCSKRLTKRNVTGLCRDCLRVSYAYEFQCAKCGKIRSVTGQLARYRRVNERRKGFDGKQFCDRACAASYARIRENKLLALEVQN